MVKEREQRPSMDLVEDFLAATEEEDPRLFKNLAKLDEKGRVSLLGILGRFDRGKQRKMGARERLLSRRVLGRLRKPNREALALTNKILDYLDLNANASLEDNEMELCIEVLDVFARADSENETLSELELKMLYAVLRNLDENNNFVLDFNEVRKLRQALKEPRLFLEREKRENPLIKELLAYSD